MRMDMQVQSNTLTASRPFNCQRFKKATTATSPPSTGNRPYGNCSFRNSNAWKCRNALAKTCAGALHYSKVKSLRPKFPAGKLEFLVVFKSWRGSITQGSRVCHQTKSLLHFLFC